MSQREIEMELPCELNDADVTERALQMSATMAEIDEVDSNKRDKVKSYNERLQFLHGRLRSLGDAVRTRSEKRIVKCVVEFHVPTPTIKRTTRTDTGEVLKEEPMSDVECQKDLFDLEKTAAPEPQDSEGDET
jgi:hypothetical protein